MQVLKNLSVAFVLILSVTAGADFRTSINTQGKDPLQLHEEWKERAKESDPIAMFTTEETPEFLVREKNVIDPQISLISTILDIRNAQHTFDLATYIFKQEPVPYMILNELKKAIERGVSVRVLVDSLGSFNLFHAELKALYAVTPGEIRDEQGNPTGKKAFVEIRIFNSISKPFAKIKIFLKGLLKFSFAGEDYGTGFRWLNRRSHSKMTLKDINYPEINSVKVGGRNMSDVYFGVPEINEHTYNDADTLLSDSPLNKTNVNLATTIGADFDHLFYSRGTKVLELNLSTKTDAKHLKRMEEAEAKLFPEGSTARKKLDEMTKNNFTRTDLRTFPTRFVTEIQNLTRPHGYLPGIFFQPGVDNPNSVIKVTADMMKKATKSIYIISPYLFLNDKDPRSDKDFLNEVDLLLKWLELDPSRRLNIVSNSILTTDNLPAQGMVDIRLNEQLINSERAQKLKGQINLFELGRLDDKLFGGDQTYGKLHAKLSMVDNEYVLFTTSNADGRSRIFNAELGFVHHSPEAVEDFMNYYKELESKSLRVMSPEWQQMYNHPALKKKRVLTRASYRCVKGLEALMLKKINLEKLL